LPGRSNALAIAQRLGLDISLIEAARHMVALEDLAADDLLDEIQRTRANIRQQNDEIESLRAELRNQRDQLQARIDKIEDERRDVVRAARRNAEEELEGFKRELRKMQSEMKMAGMPLDKVRALQEAAQKMLEWTHSPMDENEVERISDSEDWTPRLGDTVYLETLNAEGTIVELDDKGALVQVGTLKVRARTSDMRKRNRSEKRATERGHKRIFKPANVPPPVHASPGLELDLRGHSVEEALDKLDRYVDAAYMAGLPFGRIIHGKGTGRLRQAVQEYLTGHALINKLSAGEANEGGAGVTIIHLAQVS
jgi:DNA mismatch repair protein MutS2